VTIVHGVDHAWDTPRSQSARKRFSQSYRTWGVTSHPAGASVPQAGQALCGALLSI
jgi:hypothetical protein